MPYPPPPSAVPSNDRTTLWGVLGIVLSVCCLPVGVVFDILCLLSARKAGKSPVLAYIGFAIVALSVITNLILLATGSYHFSTSTSP